jgi:hypothetical protein
MMMDFGVKFKSLQKFNQHFWTQTRVAFVQIFFMLLLDTEFGKKSKKL